ncbi:MAG TPA: hypothetical protein VK997_05400 [Deferrisomatales bacterium]|nr:hypothetical protein [Deferrisomatales bacterium]
MDHRAKPWAWFGAVSVAMALTLAGMVSTSLAGTFSCEGAKKIEAEVSPDAELVSVGCSYKDYKKHNSLHFDVKIKNISAQPQRYRVNIFLDNGKAVGGLIPDKGKPPVLQPGEEAAFTYPVQGMADVADAVTILVKTLSP